MRHPEAFIGENEKFVNVPAAYERAEKVLANPIDPRDFADIYKDVDADIKWVGEMEAKFREDERQHPERKHFMMVGRCLEAIVYESDQHNWFGENATILQTSRFDDIKNGTDSIVEIQEGSGASHLALGIDVTTSTRLAENLERILTEIRDNRLAEIKYFQSDHLSIRGHMSNIPRVVIGADKASVYEVIDTWMSGKNKELAIHPIQHKILEEIRIQLGVFREYAEHIGKTDLARIYENTLLKINEIIESNPKVSDETMLAIRSDEVFDSIAVYLDSIRVGMRNEQAA